MCHQIGPRPVEGELNSIEKVPRELGVSHSKGGALFANFVLASPRYLTGLRPATRLDGYGLIDLAQHVSGR
jgi:hypothetical protein